MVQGITSMETEIREVPRRTSIEASGSVTRMDVITQEDVMCRWTVPAAATAAAAAVAASLRLTTLLWLLLLLLLPDLGGHVTAVPTSTSRQGHHRDLSRHHRAGPASTSHSRGADHIFHSQPFSAWSAWSSCGRRCVQTRRRRCLQPPLCGAAILKEERWCAAEAAAVSGRGGVCGTGSAGTGAGTGAGTVGASASGTGGAGKPGPAGAGGGRPQRHRRDFHVVPQRQLQQAARRGKGSGGGANGSTNGSPSDRRLRYNSKLYGRWTRWTPCTRSCTTQRYRWCKRPALCGADVIREAAYCYVEGSFCQRWIERRIQQQHSDDENETDADLTSEPWVTDSGDEGNSVSAATAVGAASSDLGCGVLPGNNHTWPHVRIIGGRPSPKGRWPWQVAVLNRFREAFCGGTLVAARWVLTAAHCVRKRLYVRIGEHDLSLNEGTEIELKVLEAVQHPQYDADTVDNDIALLRLPSAVRPGRWRAYACLPRSRQPLPQQQLCSIIGWGKRRSSDAFGTDILHEAQVPIVSWKACREVYADYRITANMFCAGYARGRMDSCAGDSGGPLLCRQGGEVPRWTVFGITSFGEGCGKRGKFGIYTRLPNYVAWVQAEMRRRESQPPQQHPALVPAPAQRRRRRRRRRPERKTEELS